MKSRIPLRSLKRPEPTSSELAFRADFLAALRDLTPLAPIADMPKGLAPGNRKTGESGRFFKRVFVWNLPAVATCPGSSHWCLHNCYNGDRRVTVFPVNEWRENWAWFLGSPNLLKDVIVEQLRSSPQPNAVRIHSSGDFFSIEYIQFWLEIASAAPLTSFWAYTRSWTMPDLVPYLETLRNQPNVELFASWDSTMPAPPPVWRLSIITDPGFVPAEAQHANPIVCPEQTGDSPNCASCGYCAHPERGSVLFYLH
jgi:Gene product 88